MKRIDDMAEQIQTAQEELNDEEQKIQKNLVPDIKLPASLEKITSLLLQVEKLIEEKTKLKR